MRIRLLIIDSDKIMCNAIAQLLVGCGYECVCALSGLRAISLLEKQIFHLVVMDHQLCDIGGFYLLKQILILQQTQVVILSSDDSEYNRIRALNEGATDFVAKPLAYPTEFVWRVRAILKRSLKDQIILSRVQINLTEKVVQCDGARVNLNSRLFQFLVALAMSPGQVVKHDQLLYALDESYGYVSQSILYVLAHRLRDNLEQNSEKPQLIRTIRGVGYMLNDWQS